MSNDIDWAWLWEDVWDTGKEFAKWGMNKLRPTAVMDLARNTINNNQTNEANKNDNYRMNNAIKNNPVWAFTYVEWVWSNREWMNINDYLDWLDKWHIKWDDLNADEQDSILNYNSANVMKDTHVFDEAVKRATWKIN